MLIPTASRLLRLEKTNVSWYPASILLISAKCPAQEVCKGPSALSRDRKSAGQGYSENLSREPRETPIKTRMLHNESQGWDSATQQPPPPELQPGGNGLLPDILCQAGWRDPTGAVPAGSTGFLERWGERRGAWPGWCPLVSPPVHGQGPTLPWAQLPPEPGMPRDKAPALLLLLPLSPADTARHLPPQGKV